MAEHGLKAAITDQLSGLQEINEPLCNSFSLLLSGNG